MLDGRQIRLIRQHHHITLKTLSERSGVSVCTICNMEHGRHNATVMVYERLLRSMGYKLCITKGDKDVR